MGFDELSDKAIKDMMKFYVKYRVEYEFKKVFLLMQTRLRLEKEI